jgi:hypothetical protein
MLAQLDSPRDRLGRPDSVLARAARNVNMGRTPRRTRPALALAPASQKAPSRSPGRKWSLPLKFYARMPGLTHGMRPMGFSLDKPGPGPAFKTGQAGHSERFDCLRRAVAAADGRPGPPGAALSGQPGLKHDCLKTARPDRLKTARPDWLKTARPFVALSDRGPQPSRPTIRGHNRGRQFGDRASLAGDALAITTIGADSAETVRQEG